MHGIEERLLFWRLLAFTLVITVAMLLLSRNLARADGPVSLLPQDQPYVPAPDTTPVDPAEIARLERRGHTEERIGKWMAAIGGGAIVAGLATTMLAAHEGACVLWCQPNGWTRVGDAGAATMLTGLAALPVAAGFLVTGNYNLNRADDLRHRLTVAPDVDPKGGVGVSLAFRAHF